MPIMLDDCSLVLCPRHNMEWVGMYNDITEVIMRRLQPRKIEKRARNRIPGPFLDCHNSAHSGLCDFRKVVDLWLQWNDPIKSLQARWGYRASVTDLTSARRRCGVKRMTGQITQLSQIGDRDLFRECGPKFCDLHRVLEGKDNDRSLSITSNLWVTSRYPNKWRWSKIYNRTVWMEHHQLPCTTELTVCMCRGF